MTLTRNVQFGIAFTLAGLSFVWLYEAFTCGFCWVSRYVAPVVIVGNLAMAVNGIRNVAKANARK